MVIRPSNSLKVPCTLLIRCRAVKPTVVFLSHGMASSFNGALGLPKFEDDMRKLVSAIEEIAGKNVRLVFLGPITHEKLAAPLPDPTEHNQQLKLYSEALAPAAIQALSNGMTPALP